MRRIVCTVSASVLLAGCAGMVSHSVPPGLAKQDVVARWGQPQAAYPLPNGGERLQYSLQPLGRRAWMVDMDASGHVAGTRQVLSEEDFHRIVVGQWTRDDVQREFGPPAVIDRVGGWSGPVMTYRWTDPTYIDRSYSIYLDGNNIVRRAHPWLEDIGGGSSDRS